MTAWTDDEIGGTVWSDQDGTGVEVSAFAKTLLNDADAATARATLDAASATALAASTGSSLVGHQASGTGAVSTTVQAELRETITPLQFGGTGDGVANDSAAVLAASVAAVAQGKDVDFGGHTWLLGTQIALTSSHNGLRWRFRGATVKKGFSGDLVTVTNTASFAVTGSGTFHGQHGTYTGKGFVFSGASSTNPYFGAGILFDSFTDTHIEFGADAGKYAKVDSNHRAHSSQSDPRMIHCTGTDTTAMQRDINGSMNGYIDLDAAISTHVRSPLITRVEIASTCEVTIVAGVSWSNSGSAMTLSGANSIVTGCRFSGDVTLDANFTGVFLGNQQTSGTFTNSTVAGNALVYHHPLSAVYNLLAKNFLSLGGAYEIQLNALLSPGDAAATFTPDSSPFTFTYATALTADRAVTLTTTGARAGMRLRIARTAGNTGGPWALSIGSTGTSLAQNQWCDVDYTGSFWRVTALGRVVRFDVVPVATGSAYGVSTTQQDEVFTNEGATARQDFNLPTAAAGRGPYTFTVQDADGVRVIAASGDTIRIAASVSAAAGRIDSTTIGDSVTLVAVNATEWMATSLVGAGWTAT